MTGRGQDDEWAVGHPQGRHAGVDVVVLGEHREGPDAAVRVDLLDFLARHPAQDVEVVDGEIAEQTARAGDVRLVRRGGVMAGEIDRVERPEFARRDQSARLHVPGVESPLEPQLERHAAPLDLVGDGDRVGEIHREGLLAEGRQATPDRRARQLGVGFGRRRDDDAIGLVEGRVDGRGGGRSDRGGDLHRPVGIGVRDDQLVDLGRLREEPCVHPPDPSGSEQRDPHRGDPDGRSPGPWRRRADASTRRPIAALSDGGPQVVSCSTISQPS